MKLPFLIFCVSKIAFLQLLSKRKQLSMEFLVTLEGPNLISGDSTGIFSSSFNNADESEMLHQIQDTKYEKKKKYFGNKYSSNLFFSTQIKYSYRFK